ncbi:VOC family protein [Candidatus Riflebacteria bacterium]
MEKKNSSVGTFVWCEHLSFEPERAKEFYSQLFGWNIKETEMEGSGKYEMIHSGETPIGGLGGLQKGEQNSYWLAYLSVANLEESIETIEKNGGKIHLPITNIPNIGSFTIATDSQGAIFAPFKSVDDTPGYDSSQVPTSFCWHELLTREPQKACSFYRELLNWEFREMDFGEEMPYQLVSNPGAEGAHAGITKRDRTAWLQYISVDEVDSVAKMAEKLGGKVLNPPADIQDIGRFCQVEDPTGAVFFIFKWAKG